jgi:hypothetical protein
VRWGAVTTTAVRLTPHIGIQRSGSETVPRPEPEPIFNELVARWENVGRAVPGAGRTMSGRSSPAAAPGPYAD